jgi:hypothetical protein
MSEIFAKSNGYFISSKSSMFIGSDLKTKLFGMLID